MTMKIDYIVCKNRKEVKKIARQLIRKKLAVCVNMFPIESVYLWNNKITEDKEFVLIAKTFKNKAEKLKKEVKKIHSYDIPCILEFNVRVNKEYENYMKNFQSLIL